MNETILTPRQKFIVNIVNKSEAITREEIGSELKKQYPVSRPTLIRDLNYLIRKKLITAKGRARNTQYIRASSNPFLAYFDIDQYFLDEPDRRKGARKSFNFDVFDYCEGLLTNDEKDIILQQHRSFSKSTKSLSKDILKKELERFVIELSWKSSKIEGNTYTLLETEKLIQKNQASEGRSKEEAIMILNHKFVFEKILENISSFKKISESQIKQLHNLIVKDLGISTGYRKHAVGITGTVYKPLDNMHQINEAMESLIKMLSKMDNPVERALCANAFISYIQPFTDGNKRTGRMLANAILLSEDYFPLSYRSIDEDEFKKALILFYEQNSIIYLKRLFIDQLLFAYQNYFL